MASNLTQRTAEIQQAEDHRNSDLTPCSSTLKILCNNIGHTFSASDVLRKISTETLCDFVLVQEPVMNQRTKAIAGWGGKPCQNPATLSTSSRVCSIATKVDCGAMHIPCLSQDSIAVSKLTWNGRNILIVNAYMHPHEEPECFLSQLDHVLLSARERNIVIAGDWNSRSTLWGDNADDSRSDLILSFAAAHQLAVVENNTRLPTFVHNVFGESFIDFALCKLDDEFSVSCKTLEEITHDHRPLLLTLSTAGLIETQSKPRYNTAKANWQHFHDLLQQNHQDALLASDDVDCLWHADQDTDPTMCRRVYAKEEEKNNTAALLERQTDTTPRG